MARTDYIQPDPIDTSYIPGKLAGYAENASNKLHQNVTKPVSRSVNSARKSVLGGANKLANGNQVVRGGANSLRERMKVNPGVNYRQQAVNLGNEIVDTGANAGKAILGGVDATRDFFNQDANGMRLNQQSGANTQQDLATLGNNIQGAGNGILSGLDKFSRAIASPFEQGGVVNDAGRDIGRTVYDATNNVNIDPQGMGNNILSEADRLLVEPFRSFGRDLGGYAYDATHKATQDPQQQQAQITEQNAVAPKTKHANQITVGSPEARAAHQGILDQYNIKNTPASTDAPGKYQTNDYRDASISTGNKVDSEGDTLGVSMGAGSVSGLKPEQAERIQNSLALGNQVVSPYQPNEPQKKGNTLFGRPVDQSQQRAGISESARAQVMQAMRDGTISADKADALMNRDFRASDRMDRLGGGAQSYIKPDAQPTNAKEAMAYAQNLNNFTRNGELSEQEALVAQQSYLKSLGGIYGVANSGKAKSNSKVVMQKQYDQGGNVTGENPYVFDPSNNSYKPLGGEDKGTTQEEIFSWYDNKKTSEKGKTQYDDLMMELYGMTMKEYIEGKK